MPQTAELRTEVQGVIAICDIAEAADSRRCAIWHVGTSPEDTVPRLRGAWVVERDEEIQELLRGRVVWVLSTEAVPMLRTAEVEILDPDATDAAVRAQIEAWDEVFEAEVQRSRRKFKRPDWGVTAALSDVDNTADTSRVDVADTPDAALIGRVLRAARTLETLSRQWASAQTQRTKRTFLRGEDCGGPSAAPLPFKTV